MSDSIIGYINDKTHYDVKEGRFTLFAENLKPYVEGNR